MPTKAWIEANRDKVRSYKRKFYKNNRQLVIDESKRRRERLKIEINALKASQGCLLCNEIDPCCLDFHHKDRTTKTFTVSQGLCGKTYGREKLYKEIEKCIILCSNCHRKIHAGKLSLNAIIA